VRAQPPANTPRAPDSLTPSSHPPPHTVSRAPHPNLSLSLTREQGKHREPSNITHHRARFPLHITRCRSAIAVANLFKPHVPHLSGPAPLRAVTQLPPGPSLTLPTPGPPLATLNWPGSQRSSSAGCATTGAPSAAKQHACLNMPPRASPCLRVPTQVRAPGRQYERRYTARSRRLQCSVPGSTGAQSPTQGVGRRSAAHMRVVSPTHVQCAHQLATSSVRAARHPRPVSSPANTA
jgi:hypothetical protein